MASRPCRRRRLLTLFHDLGGDGLECDYGSYTEEVKAVEFLRAQQYQLTPSAGSDFHGYGDRSFKQGSWEVKGPGT